MSDYPPSNKIISLLSAAVILLLSAVLFSCADSTPELSGTTSTVIFDYSDLSKSPSMRLAAFVETSSDVRRVENISVYSRKEKLEWRTEEPVIFADEKRQWAGYTDFVCPEGKIIPSGFYDFHYTDAEGRQADTVFTVSYNEKFASMTGTEFQENYQAQGKEKIALFSEQNMLLYFGDRKSGWKDDSAIFKSNSEAFYYRSCILLNSDSLVFLMPEVYKK